MQIARPPISQLSHLESLHIQICMHTHTLMYHHSLVQGVKKNAIVKASQILLILLGSNIKAQNVFAVHISSYF